MVSGTSSFAACCWDVGKLLFRGAVSADDVAILMEGAAGEDLEVSLVDLFDGWVDVPVASAVLFSPAFLADDVATLMIGSGEDSEVSLVVIGEGSAVVSEEDSEISSVLDPFDGSAAVVTVAVESVIDPFDGSAAVVAVAVESVLDPFDGSAAVAAPVAVESVIITKLGPSSVSLDSSADNGSAAVVAPAVAVESVIITKLVPSSVSLDSLAGIESVVGALAFAAPWICEAFLIA